MESKAEMRITSGTAKTPVEPHTAGRNVMVELYRNRMGLDWAMRQWPTAFLQAVSTKIY
jgi:hypothetical protein